MKTRYLYLLLLLTLWGASPALAQNDLMDAFKEGAKQYNEQEGNNGKPEELNSEQAEEWKKQWEETKNEYSAGMDYFNTKELNCLFLMVLYVDGYQKLEQTAKNLKDCDLYGIQATAIALSTTMMYCPEHISKLSDEEFEEFAVQFNPLWDAKDESDLLQKWFDKYDRIASWEGDGGPPFAWAIDVLVGYFSPVYVVSKTIEIGRIMEQLGCDDR